MAKRKETEPDRVVYMTTNLINGKKYIGKDKWNNDKYFGSGNLISLALEKHGKAKFQKEVVCH